MICAGSARRPEARLAQLARWVVDAEGGGERYGLKLPGASSRPTADPSTATTVWRRSRSTRSMTRAHERGARGREAVHAHARGRPLARLGGAALGGGMLLHVDRVPAWGAAAALILLVASRRERARVLCRAPSTRALLAVLVAIAVLVRFHTLNGLAAGTALLCSWRR